MRCTKCGNISWDHSSICNACGQDLTEIKEALGNFPQPEPGFSWFEAIKRETKAVDRGSDAPVDLSKIDVSDLVEEKPPTDIDLDEIDELVEDEELQEVLDKSL